MSVHATTAPFLARCLALALAAMLCASCGAKREVQDRTVAVTMTVELDAGFVAQQAGILNRIQAVHDDLEWKYNKGTVITKNVAGTIIVIALVAGVLILSDGDIKMGGGSAETIAPVDIVIADRTCTTIYLQRSLKPGTSTLSFKAPPGEEVYIFAAMREIRYALNKFDTPTVAVPMAADLRLVTSTLTVKPVAPAPPAPVPPPR